MPREQERQVCSMPSWIGEESLLHQWVQHDAIMSRWDSWLGPLASGHVLAPTVLLFLFFFSPESNAAGTSLHHEILYLQICVRTSPPPVPLAGAEHWMSCFDPWVSFLLQRAHLKPTTHKYPFLSFLYWSAKQLQHLKVFTHLGEGKRYTNCADLSSSGEISPSELQHEPPAKLFH